MPFLAGHCHVHDEYSPLDGTGDRNQLSFAAANAGQTFLGFTNHGRLGGALEHIDACSHPEKYDNPLDPSKKRSKDERLKAILGIEAFWRPSRFMDLSDALLYGKQGHNWAEHLCLHAANLPGWRTLMRLSSKSWVRRENGGGFYGKACMDWDMLEQDHEGIIISTACMSSPLSHLILAGDESGARDWLRRAQSIVRNRLMLEIMPHDLEQQRTINAAKVSLGYELGIPFMASGDVHMPFKEWVKLHSVVRMASYKTTISKQEKKAEAGEDTYTEEIDSVFLSSTDEMFDMFMQHHPYLGKSVIEEAIDNTAHFSKMVHPFIIGKTTKLPKVARDEIEAEHILRTWCIEGLKRIGKFDDKAYRTRWEYEFDVLKRKGVIDYFLLVGDMVRWAKSTAPMPVRNKWGKLVFPKDKAKKPIRVGLGRGSAAGCLISYLIGVTAIDPIAWGLLFERFLNPDRVGLPDIDLDFQSDRRHEIKEYLAVKYGHDHVADIIAYQTFAPRAVIRAVAQTQDIKYNEIDAVTDTIGDTERNLAKLVKDNEVLAAFAEKYPFVWDCCLKLEDQIMRDSRHAGGVLVTPKPVTYYMPTQLGNDDLSVVTAWSDRADFPVVSDYGFVKIDVLGVRGLEKQQLAVDMILEHYDEEFEPNELPVLKDPYAADQRVIDAFVRGMTLGVFQFGGRGITQLLRHIKPTNAIDIAVANALYRPGPIKIAFEYGDRKNGKVPDTEWYWHDALEPLLGETLGLIAFQEQVMEITKVLGNFTGGDADSMRKAISKLYRLPGDEARKFMERWRSKWIEGCLSNGLTEPIAVFIWEKILEFAGYGFNKSHSASYALQAYQDMHIKVFYALAFYASLLTVEKKDKKQEQEQFLRGVLREARVFGVEARRPDVNRSYSGWRIDGNGIRYGLVSINDIGKSNADAIVATRSKRGTFHTFEQFMRRMPSNFSIASTVALAKSGGFDDIADRRELLGQTARWADNTVKFKVEMTCGCKKVKTVKLGNRLLEKMGHDPENAEIWAMPDLMERAIDFEIDAMECKRHDGGVAKNAIPEGNTYTAIEHFKEKKGKWPERSDLPTNDTLIDMEQEALNIALSAGNIVADYWDFINERVYTEEEIEDMPAKPSRSGKKHGSFCGCEKCRAAEVIVGGEVVNAKVIQTKSKQEDMAFVDVAFGVNQWSCTFFPWAYEKFKGLIHKPGAYLIAGHKDNRGQIMAYDMMDVADAAEEVGWTPPQRSAGEVIHMQRAKRRPKIKSRKKVAA